VGELDEDEMRELLVIEIDHLRAELAEAAVLLQRVTRHDPDPYGLGEKIGLFLAKWLPKDEGVCGG